MVNDLFWGAPCYEGIYAAARPSARATIEHLFKRIRVLCKTILLNRALGLNAEQPLGHKENNGKSRMS